MLNLQAGNLDPKNIDIISFTSLYFFDFLPVIVNNNGNASLLAS